MTASIFLVIGIAMMAAVAGRRDIAVGLFAIGLVASIVWLDRHMTTALALSL